ncbi:MAG: aspartate/glutamate racemase family protein [Chloroflexota bacterium]
MLRIVVINPNSNTAFTQHMDEAVEPLRFKGAVQIDCQTLVGTPLGIETQRDIDSVIDPVCATVQREEETSDAFVIACFADTGVASARELTAKPIIGICEAGIATALNYGERYGVVSTSQAANNAELRLIRAHGLDTRLAGNEPVDIAVVDMLTSPNTFANMLRAGEKLKRAGAEVLVLGCAGMTPYRHQLSQALSLPVIDPTVAATTMAIGMVMQQL